MGAQESRPAPKQDDLGIGQMVKYGIMGALGAIALKVIIDKASEEERSNGCGGSRPTYPSNPPVNTNGNTRGSHVQNQQRVPGSGYSSNNSSIGSTQGRNAQIYSVVARSNYSSNPGGSSSGSVQRSYAPSYQGLPRPSNQSAQVDAQSRRIYQAEYERRDKACGDQMKRLENIINCYQGEPAEIEILQGELEKWIHYEGLLTDRIVYFRGYPDLNPLLLPTPPSDEGINTFMQRQRNADCLDKIFWDKATSSQKNILKAILYELKRFNPNEPESELRKGVVLAYNKHKWGIIPNQTRKYKKRSQELFLLEKQRVQLLRSSFNIAVSNAHSLDEFMLWKNFQLTIEKIFWEEATPEKKLLLDELMTKLVRIHPNLPELKLRQAVVKVFNKHKGGVRPREFNRTLQLVGNLLNSERKGDQSNNNESEDVCSICLSEFDARRVILECRHSFHRECISTWIEEDRTCPNCRHPCFTVPNVTPTPSSSVVSAVGSSHVSTGAISRQGGSRVQPSSISYATSRAPISTGTITRQGDSRIQTSSITSYATSRGPVSTGAIPRQGGSGMQRPATSSYVTSRAPVSTRNVSTYSRRPIHVSTGAIRRTSAYDIDEYLELDD